MKSLLKTAGGMISGADQFTNGFLFCPRLILPWLLDLAYCLLSAPDALEMAGTQHGAPKNIRPIFTHRNFLIFPVQQGEPIAAADPFFSFSPFIRNRLLKLA
jgi:hypothetical protein